MRPTDTAHNAEPTEHAYGRLLGEKTLDGEYPVAGLRNALRTVFPDGWVWVLVKLICVAGSLVLKRSKHWHVGNVPDGWQVGKPTVRAAGAAGARR